VGEPDPDLFDLLSHAAGVRSRAVAIRWVGSEWTYADLLDAIDDGRRRLAPVVSPGDVVAIDAAEARRFVPAYWAVLACRAVAVPTGRAVDDADAATVAGANVVVAEGFERRGPPPAWVGRLAVRPALVLLTAGTTGRPKAIVHGHTGLAWALWNTASVADRVLGREAPPPPTAESLAADLRERAAGGDPPMGFYTGMPWDTISGITVLHRALLLGDTLVAASGAFDLDELTELVTSGSVHNLALAPFMARALVRRLRHDPRPVEGLLSAGIGGAPVGADLVVEAERRLGCVVNVGYGSTEAGGALAMGDPRAPLDVRATTVGRPLATVELRLAPDAGDPVVGRLHCRTPAAMVGSLEDGRVDGPGEWLDTGDLGSWDDDGNLRLHGRADHTILRGARRVDPALIETALETHTAVDRAAVTGVPSRVPGEQDVVALVVAQAPTTAADLRQHVRRRLGPQLTPQRVTFVDELPRTPDGAVRRHLLGRLVAGTGPGTAQGDGATL
jgi:acyl-CoA synthetase (AMP-forming)/AMP-acid ligase II